MTRQYPWRASVRSRLLILVLALAVPAAVLVAVLAIQSYRKEREAATQHMQSTTRAVAALVDGRIAEIRALLVGLSTSTALQAGNLAEFERRLRSVPLGPDRWLVLSDPSDQQLINTIVPTGTLLPRNGWGAEHLQTVAAGRTYISNVAESAATHRTAIFVSLPVVRDGRHAFTLTYAMSPAAFSSELKLDRFAPSMILSVVDREGTVAARHPNNDRYIGQKARPDIVDAAVRRVNLIKPSVTLEGESVLAVVTTASESGWSVAMGAPFSTLYASARQVLWSGLVISALLLTTALAMAIWIARAVLRGLDTLVADTALIGRGEPLPARTIGLAELDHLSEAMRHTAHQLQQRERDNAELYDLVARVNQAVALREIYDVAITAILRSQNADRAAILLLDANGTMQFESSHGLSETYQRAVAGHSPWSASEKQPAPVWIDDVAKADLPPELRRAVLAEGVRALAFIPLTSNKRLLGKFMVYYNAPHAFTAAGLKPVQTLASQVAFAIERQKNADELEALVGERTASLQQAVAQMEEFSYSVSHDLRAPVRAMFGYADVILQDHADQLDDTGRELLGRIQRNSRRMDRLIQDLLTYTRISRRELTLERVSVSKLVYELQHQYPEFRAERADIETEGPLPDVLAHEPSLAQVFSNLLANAVKFVRPGTRPRIVIGGKTQRGQVRLWVRDNGIGIKPEVQPRLFQMFERGSNDHAYEGTGIGLAIVRRAIERMNGTVGVSSDGAAGSTFWFELPAPSSSPSPDQTRSAPAHDSDRGPRDDSAEPVVAVGS